MKSFLPFAILFLSISAYAQPKFKLYPDSIRVELPEMNALVIFELRDFGQSESYVRNFSQTLRGVLDNVKESTGNITSASEPMRIDVHTMPEGMKEVGIGTKPYGEKQLMTIRPLEPKQTSVTILKDKGIVELLPPGWEVHLESTEYRVKVYASTFASLDSLPAQDFGIVADAIRDDAGMKTIGRKSIESQLIVQNKQVNQRVINYIHPGDMIGLGIQGGVGLVHNILYPELSLKLGLTFRDRLRRPNFRPGLVMNTLFFTQQSTEGFTTNVNTFLSGTVEVNFNKKTSQASWSGLGVGFLIGKSGDYFTGNTGKFFITHTIPNSRFSMVPEFYLTDNFKKFTFGMTLKYSF